MNLLDIIKLSAIAPAIPLISEAMRATPEVRVGSARTIPGISYRVPVLKEIGNTSGAFRDANAGSALAVHKYEQRLVECFVLEQPWRADHAVCEVHPDGASGCIAQQAAQTLEGQMQGLCKQFYYGTNATYGGAAKGFAGLIDQYDATNMAVDAGGTTATTGSSVWLVEFGPAAVQWVWGNNQGLRIIPDLATALANPITIIDSADSSKQYLGYQQTVYGRPGLAVHSQKCVVRIKKITEDSGKGLTDDLLAQALAKFPTGHSPNACFMTKRSRSQLQQSRTATSPTGQPAPFPKTIEGMDGEVIPIYVTEGLSNVEALTL